MAEEKKSWSDKIQNVFGIVIASPLLLILLVLVIPFILYFVLIKGPIDLRKKKQFLSRNKGKVILCVTTSGKYNNFKTKFANELSTIGVNDTVAFNGEIPNNMYDNYDWDQLIKRENGFPLLLHVRNKEIIQIPLKTDFQAFFKKEID
ncbi:MAG TPA: hypothetical protein PLJ08_01630, partial [Cyclobacteriaceae bacterium]|nr:hypothetical protein [Cyclobacteriaceae bacterium]